MYTYSFNDIQYQDINLAGQQGTLAGDGRPVYGTCNTPTRRWTTTRVSNKFTNVILVENTSDGSSASLTLQVQKVQVTDGWYADIACTYGLSKNMNSILSSQAISQWRFNQISGNPNNPGLAYSAFDLRHHLFAVLSYKFDLFSLYTTTVAVTYKGKSGVPFSVVYNGDVNGDRQTSSDLVYIAKDRNDVILVTSTGLRRLQRIMTTSIHISGQDFPMTFYGLDPTTGKPGYQYQHGDSNVKPWVNDTLLSRWPSQVILRHSF